MEQDLAIYVKTGDGKIELIQNAKLTNFQLAMAAQQTHFLYENSLLKGNKNSSRKPIPAHIREALLKNGRYRILGLGVLVLDESTRPNKDKNKMKLRFVKTGYCGEDLLSLRRERQALVQAQQGAADNETPPIESGSNS